MRIIISSAGRRVYVVQWFQEALRQADLLGDVYVLDHDPDVASAAAADGYRRMPAFTDDDYSQRLLDVVDELQPDLFISLNDYELTVLSQGLSEQIRSRGALVPVLDSQSHRQVADKLAMSHALAEAGVPTPKTIPLSDAVGIYELLEGSSAVIIKDRWGSGSSGLRRFTRPQAQHWLNTRGAALVEEDPKQLDGLVLQPDLGGTEYGLDIITPVRGGPVEGILARRKLGMRHGETSAAVTVAAHPFQKIAAALNTTLGIRGTVDVDVLVTEDGAPHVIDINPRFGGGYPFSHIAGADVPHYFLASTLGVSPRSGWNSYQLDFVGAKHEGIIGFETSEKIETPTLEAETAMLKHVS